jgi:hypothetical protein
MRQELEPQSPPSSRVTRQRQAWGWVLYATGARVLGLLTVSVLLAAEDAHSETYGETVGAVVLALLLYWLTHSYAQSASWRVEHGERLTVRGLGKEMWHELQFLTGAAIPLLAVIACWAAGVSLDLAIRVALFTDAALIVLVEILAGLRARLTQREMVIQTLLGAALGLLVLALRLVLH